MTSDKIKKIAGELKSHKADKYEYVDKNYKATGYYFLNTPEGVLKNKNKDKLLDQAKKMINDKGYSKHELEDDMNNLFFWVENDKNVDVMEELSYRDTNYLMEDL